MFELHLSDDNVSAGSVPITWCLDKELLADLAARQIHDPAVVIAVVSYDTNGNARSEHRKVAALKDLITYVEFHAEGTNKIFGFVPMLDKLVAQNTCLDKSGYQSYNYSILNHLGTDYSTYLKVISDDIAEPNRLAAPITVSVPAECFAAAPSQWEQSWVNRFFRYKPIDQCDYRKRRMMAYTVQPLALLFIMLPKLIALLIALAIADKGIWVVLKTIFLPVRYLSPEHSFQALEGSALMTPGDYEKEQLAVRTFHGVLFYFVARLRFAFLMPLVSMPLLLGIFWHKLFFVVSFIYILIVVIALMMALLSSLLSSLLYCFRAGNNPFNSLLSFFQSKEQTPWYLNQEEEKLLLCSNEKKPLTIAALPKKHQTLRLRYQATKAAVCKPFSR